jgi:hypothetical protein
MCERALRFIYNDYVLNYEELLEKSKMPSIILKIDLSFVLI